MTSYKIYISTMNYIKRLTGNKQTLNTLLSTFSFGTLQTEIYTYLNEYSWWEYILISGSVKTKTVQGETMEISNRE